MTPTSTGGERPRVAIAHDYLTQRGGAERVVLAMHRAFPSAAITTSLFDAQGTYPEFAALDVRVSPINRVGALRRHHRLALPVLAPAFDRLRVDAEVTLCSSSGWAHGVEVTGAKVVYCHTPARWLYVDDQAATTGATASAAGAALRVLGPALRRWDRRAAGTADRYLANSQVVARRIADVYGIEVEVLVPPVAVDVDGPQQALRGVEPGYLLCVARLMPYKQVDAVATAVARLPGERLVIVGDGPAADAVRRAAGPAGDRITLCPRVTDAELRWLYANAVALVSAAPDDFGLTPVEAAAFGVPTVGLRAAGLLETVVEGETGVFVDSSSPPAIEDGIQRLRRVAWSTSAIRAHADRFSEPRFAARLGEIVTELSG